MSERPRKRGQLLVLSAPSGAGKTTLVHEVLKGDDELRFSISYTTRKKRRSEIEGRDYFFVDEAEFERMIANDEFLEYARVFDNYYGTGRAHVAALIEQGFTALLEIDWQGARQVRQRSAEARSVFILPPSRDELERRLRDRRTDSEQVIRRRLNDAVSDMGHWDEFDFVVINDDLTEAVAALAAIIAGSGDAHRSSEPTVRDRVEGLLASTGKKT